MRKLVETGRSHSTEDNQKCANGINGRSGVERKEVVMMCRYHVGSVHRKKDAVRGITLDKSKVHGFGRLAPINYEHIVYWVFYN